MTILILLIFSSRSINFTQGFTKWQVTIHFWLAWIFASTINHNTVWQAFFRGFRVTSLVDISSLLSHCYKRQRNFHYELQSRELLLLRLFGIFEFHFCVTYFVTFRMETLYLKIFVYFVRAMRERIRTAVLKFTYYFNYWNCVEFFQGI